MTMNKKHYWLERFLIIGVVAAIGFLLVQLLLQWRFTASFEKDLKPPEEAETLYRDASRYPGISREEQDFSKRPMDDISLGYEERPTEGAPVPSIEKPEKRNVQGGNVELEEPSPGKVNVISTRPKEGYTPPVHIPTAISVNHSSSFPTMKVIIAFFGGLILCSVVGFAVGLISAKKFFGDRERLTTDGIRGWEDRQKEDLVNLIRGIDRDMIKKEHIRTINGNIETLRLQGVEIKSLLAKMGATLSIKDYIPEQKMSEGPLQIPSEEKKEVKYRPPMKPPRNLSALLKTYNGVNTKNKDEIDRFSIDWNCKKFEIDLKHFSQTTKVLFKGKQMGDFLSVDIRDSTYILPNFFSSFDVNRISMLKKCYEIEGLDKIETGDKYSIIEPATVSRLSDGSLELEKRGKIEILKTPIGKQETGEQKREPIPELKKIDIDEITTEYNKVLHNEALRGNFLKSYPCKDLPFGFQNISFPAEEDCYWVFPSFDHIISEHKIPDNLKKFFDTPPFIGSIEEITEVKPAKLRLPDKKVITGKIKASVSKTEVVPKDEISEAIARRQTLPEEEMKYTSMGKRMTVKDLLDHYNRVDIQNGAEIEQFLRDWKHKRAKMHHGFSSDKVSFTEERVGHFILVDIDSLTYLLPLSHQFSLYKGLQASLREYYEVPDGFSTAARYLVIEPATVSRLSDGSLELEKRGKIEILKTPIGKQETGEQKREPIPELKKIDIDEITTEYNKVLHNEALRGNFLKSYPCKDLPFGFQNISFPAEEDCYWVFPSFDHIISEHKIPDNLKNFFDAPPFIGSIEKIAKIKPAKLRLPDLTEERGKIEIKD